MNTLRLEAAALALAVILGFEGAALSQAVTGEASASDVANARVRRYVGMSVENQDGAKLGVVRDFVVDFHTGRITYAIVSSSGILGLRSQLTVVPPQALSTATVKARTLALDVSKKRWNDAPHFKKKDLQQLAERTQEVLIYQFYNLPVPGTKMPHGSGSPSKGQLQLASTVMGAKLVGARGEELGRVSGLLLDLAGPRPVMALITLPERAAKKETCALPLKSLSLAGRNELKTIATQGMFDQALLLTARAWQTASTKENTVYRYE